MYSALLHGEKEAVRGYLLMRPIVWGFIVFAVCAALMLMSTIFAIFEALGEQPGFFTLVFFLTMLGTVFSIPVALVAEVVGWWRRRKARRIKHEREKEEESFARHT